MFVPLLLPIIKVIHETNAKIEAEKKMCKERRTFVTPISPTIKRSSGQILHREKRGRFQPKKLERFRSITETLMSMLTTENDTLTILYYILVTFNDLEDGIQQKLFMKT